MVCGLHSQVGIVAAIVKDLEPAARVVYVMTDGAALPLALSDLTAALRATGTVTPPSPPATLSAAIARP